MTKTTTKTTKIATWHNLVAKRHEATLVTPGRPFQAEATVEAREKSKRTFGAGSTAAEAVEALVKALKLKGEVEVVKASETSMVYKGKRDMPYNRTAPETTETPEAA